MCFWRLASVADGVVSRCECFGRTMAECHIVSETVLCSEHVKMDHSDGPKEAGLHPFAALGVNVFGIEAVSSAGPSENKT